MKKNKKKPKIVLLILKGLKAFLSNFGSLDGVAVRQAGRNESTFHKLFKSCLKIEFNAIYAEILPENRQENFLKKLKNFQFFHFLPKARGPLKIFDDQFSEIFKKKFQKWLL